MFTGTSKFAAEHGEFMAAESKGTYLNQVFKRVSIDTSE
jgi:hypothetical protein